MLDCAKLAISYLEGWEKGDFLKDTRTQQAVIMNFLGLSARWLRGLRKSIPIS